MTPSRIPLEKTLFLMFAGAISLILLTVGAYQLIEFLDTDSFCGRLCHKVMYPEYTAYQDSPHSRVLCVDCHVGSGADYLVKSKLSGIPQIFYTVSGKYPRPVPTPIKNLRPARDICEECHRPEQFTGDFVRVHTTFDTDEANTPTIDTRIMRVGGGEQGVARDIHWHIAAEVWYLPADEVRNEIIWVGSENADGDFIEYVDPDRVDEITPEFLEAEKRLMDCVDCHNRATHVFRSPESLIDEAMVQGQIDPSLPYIKREAMQALEPPQDSLELAYATVDVIRDTYRNAYPELFAEKETVIEDALAKLKEIAKLTTFPHMRVTADTYISHGGHEEGAPGCLRCHGKLESTTGEPTVISEDCTACHYLQAPITGTGTEPTDGGTAPIAKTPTPTPHPLEGRENCLTCHDTGAFKPFPDDHAGRTSNTCVGCHPVGG
jgi:hypothetical protein